MIVLTRGGDKFSLEGEISLFVVVFDYRFDSNYEKQADDAVDYEDIHEEYEGPEVQISTEEDLLLSKRDYFSTKVPLSTLENTSYVFDDENCDEDDDLEKEQKVEETRNQLEASTSGGFNHLEEKQPETLICKDVPDSGSLDSNLIEVQSKDAVDSAYLVAHSEGALDSEHFTSDTRDAPHAKRRTQFSRDVQMTLHHGPQHARTAAENRPSSLA